jgi:hypothetical protein
VPLRGVLLFFSRVFDYLAMAIPAREGLEQQPAAALNSLQDNVEFLKASLALKTASVAEIATRRELSDRKHLVYSVGGVYLNPDFGRFTPY